jgi:hypothetical protein
MDNDDISYYGTGRFCSTDDFWYEKYTFCQKTLLVVVGSRLRKATTTTTTTTIQRTSRKPTRTNRTIRGP